MNASISQFLSGLGISFTSASDATALNFGGGGTFNNGSAGLFRLFDEQLGAAASAVAGRPAKS